MLQIILAIVVIVAILSIPFIVKKIRKEMGWNAWKSDVNKMTTNYIGARDDIQESNNKLEALERAIKQETNPQEKARLFELAKKQYVEDAILWAGHEINHTATFNAIKDKYVKD